MNNILNQNNEKVISLTENFLKGSEDNFNLSDFTNHLQKILMEVGCEITQKVLELIEENIYSLPERKETYVVKDKHKKNLITIFGEVHYVKRYYENTKTKERIYLSDKILNFCNNIRMVQNVEERLIKEAVDSTYAKAGDTASYNVKISKQTVKNKIAKIQIPKEKYLNDGIKKKVENLFIIADEDHVHLQHGKMQMPRLISVYDGIRKEGKRINLQNKKNFGGLYERNIDALWEEVLTYIDTVYDIDKIKTIYILGDGASWIKTGLEWLPKSKYVLDTFHMNKAINSLVGKIDKKDKEKLNQKKELYARVGELDFDKFKEIAYEILSLEMNEITRMRKKKQLEYILNNKEGIRNGIRNKDKLHGCSAEGQVSWIYSDRLSSRPKGWCLKNLDKMARLCVFKSNARNISELFKNEVIHIDEYKKIRHCAKEAMKVGINFSPISLPIISFGNKEEKIYFKDLLLNSRNITKESNATNYYKNHVSLCI